MAAQYRDDAAVLVLRRQVVSNDIDLELHRKNLRDVSRRDVLATMAKLGIGGALGAAGGTLRRLS